VEALAGLALLAVVAVVEGVNLAVTVVAVPAIAAVLLVWVAALSLLLATVTVFFRDLRHVLPFAIQLGFIVTPVMYPSTILPARFHWVTVVNPFAVVIEATRDVVLRHVWPDWSLLAVVGAAGVMALGAALAYCRSVELRFADLA
jgi:ABC-type polysaccharide/polyol phosphate export permease